MEAILRSRSSCHEAPEAVLARIVPGDPLRLRPIVAERLRARALFLDARQVATKAYVAIALSDESTVITGTVHSAATSSGTTPDRAARRRQRAALEQVVERVLDEWTEPGQSECTVVPAGASKSKTTIEADDEAPSGLASFAGALGFEPGDVARGLAEFHRAPLARRRLFREFVIERRPLRSLAAEVGLAPIDLLREVREAFACLVGPSNRHGARAFSVDTTSIESTP